MHYLPENVQITIVIVTGVIIIASAFASPWLFVFLITIGLLIWLVEYLKPFSEFGKFRRLFPTATKIIDQNEERFADLRSDIEIRESVVKHELAFVVDRLKLGHETLKRIDGMRSENSFEENGDLNTSFNRMIDKTIDDAVQRFLELSDYELSYSLYNKGNNEEQTRRYRPKD